MIAYKLGNNREKGAGNESETFLLFQKIGSVGRWETRHFMAMTLVYGTDAMVLLFWQTDVEKAENGQVYSIQYVQVRSQDVFESF